MAIEQVKISSDNFTERMNGSKTKLATIFAESKELEGDILTALAGCFMPKTIWCLHKIYNIWYY